VFICVSLNPAMDKRLRLVRLQPGRVNRLTEVASAPGGKAAHVAMVLRTLGADPLWLGFAGGPAGTALVKGLNAMSIRTEAVTTANATRANLEILENDGAVTEILEPGPPITSEELERLQLAFERALGGSAGKTAAILSGSLPPGVPEDYYATLIALGHQRGCCMFVDTSGEPLRLALKANPELVKPNQQEAEWLSEYPIDGPRFAEGALNKILSAGAKSAAISFGAHGLVWRPANEEKVFLAKVPQLVVRSAVGSGDAALAGFAFAENQGLDPADSLRLAAACGSANCLAEGPGRARASDIARLKKEIQVEILP
jgi:1-phosphofructokinase family hexose kinase